MTTYSPGIKATTGKGLRKVRRQWTEASPFKTVEDLIQAAPEPQEELGKAIDEIAQLLGVGFKNPGAKSKSEKGIARIYNKAAARGHVAARVIDVVRAAFLIDEPKQADQIVAQLAQNFEVIVEPWKVTPVNYFDRTLLVHFGNGVIGEVLIIERTMAMAKYGSGDGLYVQMRDASPTKENSIMEIGYGAFEMCPARWTPHEAWVLYDDDVWREIHPAELMVGARLMTEAEFKKTYGHLPPMPRALFCFGSTRCLTACTSLIIWT